MHGSRHFERSAHTNTRNINAIEIERVTAKNDRKRATKYTLHTYAPVGHIGKSSLRLLGAYNQWTRRKPMNLKFSKMYALWLVYHWLFCALGKCAHFCFWITKWMEWTERFWYMHSDNEQLMYACLNGIWISQDPLIARVPNFSMVNKCIFDPMCACMCLRVKSINVWKSCSSLENETLWKELRARELHTTQFAHAQTHAHRTHAYSVCIVNNKRGQRHNPFTFRWPEASNAR